MVFRSTSGECGKPFDMKVIWLVHIHFFSASFFSHIIGWDGGGCHNCQGFHIRYIHAHVVSQIDVLWAHFTLPDLVILATSFVVSQLSFVVFCRPHLDCHHSGHPHISESHLSKFHVREQVK